MKADAAGNRPAVPKGAAGSNRPPPPAGPAAADVPPEGGVASTVTVVGSGENGSELAALNLSLGSPARMAGWLGNDSAEFKALLERAAIYVLPSDFENFPVSLLEAMSAGCAIVTTSGHGCEEVVGDAALLVTPGSTDRERCIRELREALRSLTTDRARTEALGVRARRRLDDNFAWNAVARAYVELYLRHSVV